jgi:hypothetical protein
MSGLDRDPSLSPPLASDAPVSQSQLNQMLTQITRQQQDNMHQFQSALQQVMHQFQQHTQQQAAASSSAAASSAVPINHSNRTVPVVLPPGVKLAKPNIFTGAPNSNVDIWIFEMEQYQIGSGIIEDAQRILVAASYLKDGAMQWWRHKCDTLYNPPSDWNEFKEALKVRFQPLAASRTARANLRNLRQGNRSVADYSNAFLKQIQMINDMSEADQIEHFMVGLQSAIHNEVDMKDPKSLQEAMTYAQRTELRQRTNRQTHNNYSNPNYRYRPPIQRTTYENKTTSSSSSASAPMELGNISTGTPKEDDQYNEEYEKYLEEGDEYEIEETVDTAEESGEQEDDTAEEQLQAMYSSNRLSNPSNQRRPTPSRVANLSREEFIRLMKERKCLRCKKPGHFARNCTQPPSQFRNHSHSRPSNSQAQL